MTEANGTKTIISLLAGDVLIASADTATGTDSATYVKLKEITIKKAGTYRVKFGLVTWDEGCCAYGRVYKNGVAHGTERSADSDVCETKSEDLAFSVNDLCQLYAKIGGTNIRTYVKEFRIYTAEGPFDPVVDID
jgi:hypothetical protein